MRVRYFTTILIILLLVLVSSCTIPTSQPTIETPNDQDTTSESITSPNTQDDSEATPITPSSQPTTITSERTQALVVDVIDGDTIEVEIGGTLFRVRYIGMDTPERGEVCYEEATLANELLVSGKTVELEKDISETDRYRRLLRYVWIEEDMVNAILVATGYAQVATYPPDVKYQDQFLELQRQAEQSGLGCWGLGEETTEPTSTPMTCPQKGYHSLS